MRATSWERSLQGLLGLAGNLGGGFLRVVLVVALAVMLTAQPKPYRTLAIRLAPSLLPSPPAGGAQPV